jgi:hypothetical protein
LLIFVSIIDFYVLKTPSIILAGIVVAIIIRQIGFPEISLALLCGIVILCCYYAAVYLYRENDSMMGGLPQAGYGYSTGMVIMLSGNLIFCASFILINKLMIYLGAFLIMIGTGFMVISSSLLFRHIIRRGLKSNS